MSAPASHAEELSAIIADVARMEGRFRKIGDSLTLSTDDETTFRAVLRDCLSVLDLVLGAGNIQGKEIVHWVNEHTGGYPARTSFYAVQGARKLMEAALKQVGRVQVPRPVTAAVSSRPQYVAQTRIDEMKALRSADFDLSRLIRMMEELNSAFGQESYISVAFLVRAIKDHVPPIFGASNFAEVLNSSPRSMKGSLEGLENLKHIADGHIHTQIRKSEVLPTQNQVDFRSSLDVLLGEVVRRLKEKPPSTVPPN